MNNQAKKTYPYDLVEIKNLAAQSLDKGALSPTYALDVNQACALLNAALATEIMCVLRYRHHQIIAKGINKIQIAAEFEEHAINEEKHMLMIAERINQLGGNPDFNPANVALNSATDYGNNQELYRLIEEDLIAERIVIMVYQHLIKWFGTEDPTTRRMLEDILEDEEKHADDLADLLSQILI